MEWRKLGYYVYVYVDPRNDEVFYIGKGKGVRALSHLKDTRETRKVVRIREISASGLEPKIEILRFGMETPEEAEKVEAACIDVMGLKNLTNEVRGKGAVAFGKRSLDEVKYLISAEEVEVAEPAILFVLRGTFYYGMSADNLYFHTRCAWSTKKLNKKYRNAVYAMAVFGSVIQEVYEIAGWFPEGTTQLCFNMNGQMGREDRVEFVGRIAPERIRMKYKYKSIKKAYPNSGWSIKGVNL